MIQKLLFGLCVLIAFSASAQDDTSESSSLETPLDSINFDPNYEDSIALVHTGSDYEAEHDVVLDTLTVTARKFDEAKLEEFRNDDDFDYSSQPTVGESIWSQFLRWLGQLLNRILSGAVTTDWGRVLLYVGALAILIVVIMALLKVDAFKILFKGAQASTAKGVFHEDIHSMDFENLIKDAVSQKDFRNAVRLIFLYSLKLLSDGQHIDWVAGKTNHDYLDELQSSNLKTGLGELSFYFDYAWYGGFSVTESQFARVKNIFENWKEGIQ